MLPITTLRRGIRFPSSDHQRIEDIVTKEVKQFIEDAKLRYLHDRAEPLLSEVKEMLVDRGVSESDMEYLVCDFSETLTVISGKHRMEFHRALFPKNRDNAILLTITELKIWERLKFSAENIAYFTHAILAWIPEYEQIVVNAEVELRKILKICEIGKNFLETIAAELCQKGLDSQVMHSFEGETIVVLRISYGNGIVCEFEINLLEEFQEKIVEITDRLCCQ
jgi:hypothetical protein